MSLTWYPIILEHVDLLQYMHEHIHYGMVMVAGRPLRCERVNSASLNCLDTALVWPSEDLSRMNQSNRMNQSIAHELDQAFLSRRRLAHSPELPFALAGSQDLTTSGTGYEPTSRYIVATRTQVSVQCSRCDANPSFRSISHVSLCEPNPPPPIVG